jgi:hypothetical protein
MARHDRLCHASLARCSQNLRRHIACRQAPTDRRPTQVLGQGVQPDIDPTIAAAVTLDVAGYVAVRESFRRASWRVVAGHVARLPSRTGSMHALMKAMPNPMRKLSIPWGSEHRSDTARRGWDKRRRNHARQTVSGLGFLKFTTFENSLLVDFLQQRVGENPQIRIIEAIDVMLKQEKHKAAFK